ncbi:choline-phosphate cytidylyltransferase [Nematocida sp. AWRm77]|nr:choline-phosphate cytidylyltransferase [Nematocida sp. AWRm77]
MRKTANKGRKRVPRKKEAEKHTNTSLQKKPILDVSGKNIPGTLRVYSDGVYDMFHYGHMRMLEQVRKTFPEAVIIAGVCSDRDTHMHKGQTVLSMEERAESLRHCKWVDEVIPDAPWIITEEFVKQHRIDYVAHDNVYLSEKEEEEDVYQKVKDLGIFAVTQRTEGISTTQLITRILNSYDSFIRRNIERGVPCKEMNISKFTEKRIKLSKSVEKNMAKLAEKFQEVADAWDSVSGYFVTRFVQMFEKK